MQLGDCLFDRQRGLLTNQVSGEQWHLPRAELQVLTLLLANQDKIVAKHTLGAGDDQYAALSDSSVTRAVFMLRSFLGPMHEQMIETVKGKGYRLHIDKRLSQPLLSQSIRSNPLRANYQTMITWLFGKHHRVLKAWVGVLVLLLCILVGGQWLVAASIEVHHTAPYDSHSITLESGQQVTFISYAKSKTNNTSLVALSQKLAKGFASCESSPWQQIYLSLSHDKQVFNITMRGEKLGQSLVRNLKLTDYRQQKSFISDAWLTEVSLCE
ncbi:winged helix-turn-helix domain-containing protein [Shewanella colwelliana]|uniref:winged helix-turn-helix domain-containing protein n=1 Tax=Shewanella colwelliana TaxID=23 RepID=UPI0022AFE851|nr:winged helix-turn-helix domain-containing protein [Shewanella colwelliana]MCZ4339016.1 winged helix-turn-helix domain-containing protein [Shewanella colwelliana]